MAALDRWSQNNSDFFGKFNCMYLYINASSNLKIEPKVNKINWKKTFSSDIEERESHIRELGYEVVDQSTELLACVLRCL